MPPRLSKLNLWKRHEERVCEVLAYALVLLQKRTNLIQDEDELNRELHFCLREANAYFSKQDRGVDTPFVYEARNQPSYHHNTKHSREDKRPDFQSGYVDHSERDPYKQDKFFCIECKRLGEPSSSNWILNENYIKNGIARFFDEGHGYGIEVESGAMVGYVESSDFDIIFQEVNNNLIKLLPELTEINFESSAWSSSECNVLVHTFDRTFPISPFLLNHFWIDLRGKLQSKTNVSGIPLEQNT